MGGATVLLTIAALILSLNRAFVGVAAILLVLGILISLGGLVFRQQILAYETSRSGDAALKQAETEWQEKARHWQGLAFCAKDDIVFDPQTGKNAPSKDISLLL